MCLLFNPSQADTPPTPPSQSAKDDVESIQEDDMSLKAWLRNAKKLLTLPFATSSIALGGVLGVKTKNF